MDTVCLCIGYVLCGLGGATLLITILGGVFYLAAVVWYGVSVRWRGVWKAESLVYEYHKNRVQFLAWKHLKEKRKEAERETD